VESLWPVESQATADLMVEFHKEVAAGMPIAKALRDAQLSLMEQHPHPYYWSSFTATGNNTALEPASFINDGVPTVAEALSR
jgi:CHAT domain-containing protein